MQMSIAAAKPSKQYAADVRAQYPTGGVPSTPLEQRVGPHPKKDYLAFKTPPTRQLSREKRQEYQLDVSERFYDDYIGGRTTGVSHGHEIGQEVHKMGFDPNLYRANAYQGLAYDPSRPVPRGMDFNHMARVETARQKERVQTQMKQRRMSDSALLQRPQIEYNQYGQPQVMGSLYDQQHFLPPVTQGSQSYSSHHRPQSAVQKNIQETVRPELVPEVEKWLSSASKEDQITAQKFLRTISSQGQRMDPASKASTHTSRVRSAVMTPSRQQRQEKEVSVQFRELERQSKGLPQPVQVAPKKKPRHQDGGGSYRRLRRSNSDVAHGSMFSGIKQKQGHFSIHPEWASEGIK